MTKLTKVIAIAIPGYGNKPALNFLVECTHLAPRPRLAGLRGNVL